MEALIVILGSILVVFVLIIILVINVQSQKEAIASLQHRCGEIETKIMAMERHLSNLEKTAVKLSFTDKEEA